ncbi:MAG TPA: NINE protein [Candidatus Acidoferrales bacterium]|jgi:TM2 domain-containing membrane protein YozV|nr:NINE protein [Candidatus Acidoferrales bacterium]
MYKIIGTDARQYGPITADQIRRWFAENRVNAQSLAQSEGSTEWKPLISFPEFSGDFNLAPPPVSGSTHNPRASNKIPAGVCAILLGCLGVHKFILGYTGAGLIMLLLTILSCGILWPILHIFGIIEGIIYLCKSDDEFVRVYVDGRREWF